MSKLPLSFETREKIPEGIREYYQERDGKYVLEGAEGFVTAVVHDEVNKRLGEFRDNNTSANDKNRTLTTELEAHKKKYEGIDPVEVQKLKDEKAALEAKGIKGPEGMADAITKAVGEAVTPLKEQVTALGTQLTEQKDATSAAQLKATLEGKRTTIMQAATEAGVRKGAISDVLNRGLDKFEVLADGSLAGIDKAKQPVYSRENAAKRQSVGEWLTELSTGDAAHLFEGSAGGGAETNADGSRLPLKVLMNPTNDEKLKYVKEIASGEVICKYS